MFYARLSRLKATTALALVLSTLGVTGYAGPTGGEVVSGSAQITSPDATTTVIDQTSQRGIIEWNTFDLGPSELLKFNLPSPDSITLNRVTGGQGPSTIDGRIDSNGRIIISNRDGIVFGDGAQIDVGALIATTADIENDAFMNGSLEFNRSGSPTGSVINRGLITARDSGLIALVAPHAENSGVLLARIGRIAVAGGDRFTVDFTGSEFLRLAIDPDSPAAQYLAKNSGQIQAEGGHVLLTTQTASDALSGVVNNSGIVEATAVDTSGGRIRLVAGGGTKVRNSGTVRSQGTTGGTIEITAEQVELTSTSIVDASGNEGGGTVLIGGDYLGGNRAVAAMNPLAPRFEDFPVYSASTTVAETGARISADALSSGDGGKVIVWSDDYTLTAAIISARGGLSFGNGGFVETSGGFLDVRSAPDVGAANGVGGTWLIDPRDIEIVEGIELFDDIALISGVYTPTEDVSRLGASLITSRLNSGMDVIVTNIGTTGGQSGDITVTTDLKKTSGGNASLSLFAADDLIIERDVNISSSSGRLNLFLSARDDIRAGSMGDLELNGGGIGFIVGDDVELDTDSDLPDGAGSGRFDVNITSDQNFSSGNSMVNLDFGRDSISFGFTDNELRIGTNGIRVRDTRNSSRIQIDLDGDRRDLILSDRAIQAPEAFEWEIPSNTLRTRSTVAEDANNGVAEVIGDPDTSFFRTSGTEPRGDSVGLIEVSFDSDRETDRVFVTTDGGADFLDAKDDDDAGSDVDIDIVIPDTDPTLPDSGEPSNPEPPAQEPVNPAPPVEEPTTPEVPNTEPTAPQTPTEEPSTPAPPIEEPSTPETPAQGPADPEPSTQAPTFEFTLLLPELAFPEANFQTGGVTTPSDTIDNPFQPFSSAVWRSVGGAGYTMLNASNQAIVDLNAYLDELEEVGLEISVDQNGTMRLRAVAFGSTVAVCTARELFVPVALTTVVSDLLLNRFGGKLVPENVKDFLNMPVDQLVGKKVDVPALRQGSITSGLGSLDNSVFAQVKSDQNTQFSRIGQMKYSSIAGEPIESVRDLTIAIRNGTVNPDDIEVDFVVINNQVVIANTRTSTALTDAGIPRSRWNGVDRTGQPVENPGLPLGTTYDDLVVSQINRNNGPISPNEW